MFLKYIRNVITSIEFMRLSLPQSLGYRFFRGPTIERHSEHID